MSDLVNGHDLSARHILWEVKYLRQTYRVILQKLS